MMNQNENNSISNLLNEVRKTDYQTAVVFLTASICIMLGSYLDSLADLIEFLELLSLYDVSSIIEKEILTHQNIELIDLIFWSLTRIVFYFIIPMLVVILIIKQNLNDYGLSIKKLFNGYKPYLLFFLFMLPLIFLVSFDNSFQKQYPFYKCQAEELFPFFVIWQLFYLFQFFSLEFLFRGFLIHGTKKSIGIYSIFLMTIPYMMIHFQKPFLETLGAIFAGIILGYMSYKTKSIWQGVFLHYCVALTMDILALYQTGVL